VKFLKEKQQNYLFAQMTAIEQKNKNKHHKLRRGGWLNNIEKQVYINIKV